MVRFCSLVSGSSGNCLFISTDETRILIDAGLSGKAAASGLDAIGVDPTTIDAILVTHEHSDHTRGVGILSRRYDIPIYASVGTWSGMERDLGDIDSSKRHEFCPGREFLINDFSVYPFLIPHDAGEPTGFNLSAEGRRVSIATDIGHVSEELIAGLCGSDLIVLESNHDIQMLRCGPYPWFLKQRILGNNGHLCNEAAAELATYLVKMGTGKVILGHLSKENNFPELAYQTALNAMTENGVSVGLDVLLDVAYRDKPSTVYKV